MKIKTGLQYEKDGGYSLALFGVPSIRSMGKGVFLIYVDCHVVAAKPVKSMYKFETIWTDLSVQTLDKMRHYAKKLAQAHIKKRGWKIKAGQAYYTQSNLFFGFHFEIIK